MLQHREWVSRRRTTHRVVCCRHVPDVYFRQYVDSHVGNASDSALDALPGTNYLLSELKFHVVSFRTPVE